MELPMYMQSARPHTTSSARPAKPETPKPITRSTRSEGETVSASLAGSAASTAAAPTGAECRSRASTPAPSTMLVRAARTTATCSPSMGSRKKPTIRAPVAAPKVLMP